MNDAWLHRHHHDQSYAMYVPWQRAAWSVEHDPTRGCRKWGSSGGRGRSRGGVEDMVTHKYYSGISSYQCTSVIGVGLAPEGGQVHTRGPRGQTNGNSPTVSGTWDGWKFIGTAHAMSAGCTCDEISLRDLPAPAATPHFMDVCCMLVAQATWRSWGMASKWIDT